MIDQLNETHNPGIKSWVLSAQEANTDFPIQNLPFGVFRRRGTNEPRRIGVAIGSAILDLAACIDEDLLKESGEPPRAACREPSLNALMTLSRQELSLLRKAVHDVLRGGAATPVQHAAAKCLLNAQDAELSVPSQIGDYSDFFASIHHATNCGRLLRLDSPLLPNYKYVPVAYHGRASSIVVSGTDIRRPNGQRHAGQGDPTFGASQRLDYELEVGVFIRGGNSLGSPIPIDEAEEHIFGFCLVNDWSARDVQMWEMPPLGPFLSKSFAVSISPWVVTTEALTPYRVAAKKRPAGDPPPLPYLYADTNERHGGLSLDLEVHLVTPAMRKAGNLAAQLSRVNFETMYWTPAQLVAHHTSNGCNLRPGDLLASGTVSDEEPDSWGSLLELTRGGRDPIALGNGETRGFLEDGDEIIFRGSCSAPGFARAGFGECRGRILPAPGAS